MSVNKVILVGRLGRDPETRYTGGGQAVCNFSMATDESFKSKSGERQKRTEWHKIVVWGKQAEIAQQYLKKGSQIFLEGRIQIAKRRSEQHDLDGYCPPEMSPNNAPERIDIEYRMRNAYSVQDLIENAIFRIE